MPLVFDILPDDIDGNAASREQAETLVLEVFLPQLLPDGRELVLDAAAARTLVGVDELAQFGFRLGGEHDVDMIDVMIPLFTGDAVVRSDSFEYLTKPARNFIVDDFPTILHDEDEVIVHAEYRIA